MAGLSEQKNAISYDQAAMVRLVEGVVDVYDSIPAYSIGSQSLRLQLAAIMRTQEPQFHIRFVDVQRQSGGSACGLFAIANATALCGGLDPHLQNFEQSKMREHLKKCFLENRLECFPESRRRRRLGRHRFVATKSVDVFCTCRLTWNRVQNQLGDLIQCEICKKWYHEVCEGVQCSRASQPTFKNPHWELPELENSVVCIPLTVLSKKEVI